jgi:hypothetical protein
MPDYWEGVRQRWDSSMQAVNTGSTDDSARLIHSRFQWMPVPLSTVQIVITGMRGAGKNVIYDALTGRIGTSYKLPPKSEKADDWKVKTVSGRSKRRSDVYIIPGQRDSAEQQDGFTKMFRRGNYPKGVIHVVSWGYDWIWDERARRARAAELGRDGAELTQKKFREQDLIEEADFFDVICDLLKESWKDFPSGIWLIIAVAKCDLYWPKIEEVRDCYLPDGGSNAASRFRTSLTNLAEHFSYGGLRNLAILPVSSTLMPFHFAQSFDFPSQPEILARPTITDAQRRALLNNFKATVGEFNAK